MMSLAHLSRMLRGEILVYQWLHRPSIRLSSVRQHFQTSSTKKEFPKDGEMRVIC